MPDPGRGHDPATETETDADAASPEAACIERTRSAVLNVLVVAGVGIAVSGWALGRHEPDAALPWGLLTTRRTSHIALIALVALAYLVLRVLAGRERLSDPRTRASRFFRGRVASATIAALAVPLGFAHGWLVDPRLDALAPFWIATLGLGFLALPRGRELDDFDATIPA
jgi:hypothetical protein